MAGAIEPVTQERGGALRIECGAAGWPRGGAWHGARLRLGQGGAAGGMMISGRRLARRAIVQDGRELGGDLSWGRGRRLARRAIVSA